MLCTPGEGQVAGSWGEMGPPCLTGLGFGHPVEQVFPPLPKLLGPGGWRELPGLTTRGEGWGGGGCIPSCSGTRHCRCKWVVGAGYTHQPQPFPHRARCRSLAISLGCSAGMSPSPGSDLSNSTAKCTLHDFKPTPGVKNNPANLFLPQTTVPSTADH